MPKGDDELLATDFSCLCEIFFSVFQLCTEARPKQSMTAAVVCHREMMCRDLREADIDAILLLDSAVG